MTSERAPAEVDKRPGWHNGVDGRTRLALHEAMDRANMVHRIFAAHVMDHSAVVVDPELSRMADKVSDAMAALYSRIADRRFGDVKR